MRLKTRDSGYEFTGFLDPIGILNYCIYQIFSEENYYEQ